MRSSGCLAAVSIISLLALPVRAEENSSFVEDMVEMGRQWLDKTPPEEVAASIDIPTLENWQTFWKSVEDALHSGSVEDLAWILPEIETAMGYLGAVPGGEPYAAWLKQRLDYFDMADQVLRNYADVPSRGPRAAVVRPGISIVPPAHSRPALLPPSASSRISAAIRNEGLWTRKLKARPAPSEADMIIPGIKEVFAAEGIPPEWAWIAEVESSLDPDVRSPSGAVGLFQLMPDTAKRYGLRTGLGDERKNPRKSAHAAAQYLRFLHGQFGSWPLTLAAYNAGEGAISRCLKKSKARSFDEIAPLLPAETQMYVPKVMATVALREGVDPQKTAAALFAQAAELTRKKKRRGIPTGTAAA